MSPISFIITLVVIGTLLSVINIFTTLADRTAALLNLAVLVCVVVWFTYALGFARSSGSSLS
jgi:hypothetical protein